MVILILHFATCMYSHDLNHSSNMLVIVSMNISSTKARMIGASLTQP
jgi:hypothetical protein